MNSFFNRIVSACRILYVRRVLLIEAHTETTGLDRVTLWGSMPNKPDQVKILRAMADSIERDHQQEERVRLVNLSKQTN
jgi:hypothetical protein